MATTDQTINLPQLLLIILLGSLAVRYFFFSSNSSSLPNPSGRGGPSSARAREADVERIQQMFPQVARRTIMWDLQRNGGNVVATTERILSGRGLEQPPQSFQPPLPQSPSATSPTSTSTSLQQPQQPKPLHPDLITRYKLESKLTSDSPSPAADSPPAPSSSPSPAQKRAWSANKAERQALLQKRRDDMILAARRKMEAKVAAEKEDGGGGGSGGGAAAI